MSIRSLLFFFHSPFFFFFFYWIIGSLHIGSLDHCIAYLSHCYFTLLEEEEEEEERVHCLTGPRPEEIR